MANPRPHRAAIYVRVSTHDQEVENQLEELRRFVEARGWEAREYLDEGVSGALEQRPALNALVRDAKRRRFDGYCQLKQNRADRSPTYRVHNRTQAHHPGGRSAPFSLT